MRDIQTKKMIVQEHFGRDLSSDEVYETREWMDALMVSENLQEER